MSAITRSSPPQMGQRLMSISKTRLAGFDLNTLRTGIDKSRAMLADGVELILQTLEHPHPLVAACTGHAFPMGAFLLLGADVRVGAAGPWKIGLDEVAIGIDVPDFALDPAASRLQPSGWRAIATDRISSPGEAIAAGYLDVVVDPDRLESHSVEVAHQLKELDRAATRSTRLRMRAPIASKIREHLHDLRPVAN